MTKSLQCEWIYLQCVIPDCGTLFAPLEHTILTRFLLVLFSGEVSQLEHQMFLFLSAGVVWSNDKVLKQFNDSIIYDGERYQAWKNCEFDLPDNYDVAYGRIASLTK